MSLDRGLRWFDVEWVRLEFMRAGVLEDVEGGQMRFRYRYKTLTEKLGKALGVHILPRFKTDDVFGGDDGENTVASVNDRPTWRGKSTQNFGKRQRHKPQRDRDDDDVT